MITREGGDYGREAEYGGRQEYIGQTIHRWIGVDHGRRQTAEVDHAAIDDTARSGQTVEAGGRIPETVGHGGRW